MQQPDFCSICGFGATGPLTAITVQGQRFAFCEGHAAELSANVPDTLAELQERFGAVGIERRALAPRRLNPRRRPRGSVEQRRGDGRRASD